MGKPYYVNWRNNTQRMVKRRGPFKPHHRLYNQDKIAASKVFGLTHYLLQIRNSIVGGWGWAIAESEADALIVLDKAGLGEELKNYGVTIFLVHPDTKCERTGKLVWPKGFAPLMIEVITGLRG